MRARCEAGPSDRTYWIRNCNPLNMLLLMNSRTYNWGYRTEPEARTIDRISATRISPSPGARL